jgi:bifunctional non-homologous end joining protein LigD
MKTSGKFVIQKHTRGKDIHWDLMLETGEALETYRSTLPPEKLTKETSPAVKIFEHPLKFLTYEGSVNQGRGNVEIADRGTYHVICREPDCVNLELTGQVLTGRFILSRTANDEWQFGPV